MNYMKAKEVCHKYPQHLALLVSVFINFLCVRLLDTIRENLSGMYQIFLKKEFLFDVSKMGYRFLWTGTEC